MLIITVFLTLPLVISISLLIVLGTLDDIYNLPALTELAIQLIAALIIAMSVINLGFISNPFGGIVNLEWTSWTFNIFSLPQELIFPGDLLIIPWIILCVNAVKWVAGSDGLLESNMIIAYLLLFILGIRDQNMLVITVSIIITV